MKTKTLNFLDQAQLGRNHWWRFLLTFLMIAGAIGGAILLVQGLLIPTLKSYPSLKDNGLVQPLLTYGVTGMAFLGMLLAMALGVIFLHRRSFTSLNAARRFNWVEVLEGILVWGAIVFVQELYMGDGLLAFLGKFEFSSNALLIAAVATLAIGIQSYAEEVIFRGYLLQGLGLRIQRKWLLFGTASLIFGLCHFSSGLDALLMTTLFGLVFCSIVVQRQSLAFASGVHFINNFFYIYLLDGFYEDSPKAFLDFDWENVLLTSLAFLLILGYTRLRKPRALPLLNWKTARPAGEEA